MPFLSNIFVCLIGPIVIWSCFIHISTSFLYLYSTFCLSICILSNQGCTTTHRLLRFTFPTALCQNLCINRILCLPCFKYSFFLFSNHPQQMTTYLLPFSLKLYRRPFVVLPFIHSYPKLHKYRFLNNEFKVCGNSPLNKFVGTTLLTAHAHFMSLCHILVILAVF